MGKRIANIQKKATSLSTEELVGTQAQRLGKTLPDPNENKIGATASTNVQTPTDVPLQKKSAEDMQKIDQANRRNYVLDGDYETAMKKGDISPAEYVQAMQHKAQTEGRELDAYETALKIMKGDDTLTPEQQAKKERRERLGQVLSNVGNLIGNVANVYYASKGGLPINLNASQMTNNERYLQAIERRKALEQKGKETLLAAKQQDIKAAREAAIEARKQAQDLAKFNAQIEFDRDKHNSEIEYKKGKDAAEAAKNKFEQEYKNKQLEEQIRSNKANEAIEWSKHNEDKKVNEARILGGYYNKGAANSSGKKGNTITLKTFDGKFVDVDMSKLNDSSFSQYYNEHIPEDIKMQYPINSAMTEDEKLMQYKEAFGYAIRNSEQAVADLVKSGVGTLHKEENQGGFSFAPQPQQKKEEQSAGFSFADIVQEENKPIQKDMTDSISKVLNKEAEKNRWKESATPTKIKSYNNYQDTTSR